jgi:hypothetical protein
MAHPSGHFRNVLDFCIMDDDDFTNNRYKTEKVEVKNTDPSQDKRKNFKKELVELVKKKLSKFLRCI